jgi:hypothetical protein
LVARKLSSPLRLLLRLLHRHRHRLRLLKRLLRRLLKRLLRRLLRRNSKVFESINTMRDSNVTHGVAFFGKFLLSLYIICCKENA